MSTFSFIVEVTTDSQDHANQVMAERIYHDEQYEDDGGVKFDYAVLIPEWDRRRGAVVSSKPTPPHELCIEQGVTHDRLKAALDSKDRWGSMAHAFEFLTAIGAVLASWPEDQR